MLDLKRKSPLLSTTNSSISSVNLAPVRATRQTTVTEGCVYVDWGQGC